MKKIDKNNKIFQSKEYQKDKNKFYIVNLNLTYDTVLLYSDEENYIICRGAANLPTWIWTKDNFPIEKLRELEQAMNIYLTDNEKDKFTCKKELYDLLVKYNYEKLNDDYFEMGTLTCKETKKPKECDGNIYVPNKNDYPKLAEYSYNYYKETPEVTPINMTQAKDLTQELINSQNFYIWKNNSGKIVCMTYYIVTDNLAKISHVYTPVEERGKGYAANLIYNVTNNLLKDGLIPLLYTDYNYIASNKAYINVGYKSTGILINFSCSKEKRKNKRK